VLLDDHLNVSKTNARRNPPNDDIRKDTPMFSYHPHLLEAVVNERRRELQRVAGNSRLRREARRGRQHRRK
jgi:hypothetical protein